MSDAMIATLQAMHSYCRPMGSVAEQQFIARFVATLPGAYRDAAHNWHVVTDPDSRVLWSCHTDTVHRDEGRQTTHYNPATGLLRLSKRSAYTSSCLGADDTVGVFLCRELVLAGVPGHYMFHYGEERGGIGSRAVAMDDPAFLSRFDCAIALDRAGYHDVITHQAGGRTASDVFTTALGANLTACDGQPFTPTEGVYTDTAEYADAIGECTNLSVGYFRQHTPAEYVDCRHVIHLLAGLVALDTTALPITRKPGEVDPYERSWWSMDGYYARASRALPDAYDDDDREFAGIESTVDLGLLDSIHDYAVDRRDWDLVDRCDARIAELVDRDNLYLNSDTAAIARLLRDTTADDDDDDHNR